MPIQFPNFDRISFEEANPWIKGALAGNQLMQAPLDLRAKLLENKLNKVKAQYAEPMAKQQLQKAILENKYYAPDIESQMSLRKAEAGKLGKETSWYDREAQARIQEAQALAGMHGVEARQAALFNKILENRFQPGSKESPTGQTIGSGVSESNMSTPSKDTTYGIKNPTLSNDDIINKKVFGLDTYSQKQEMFKTQVVKQADEYNNSLTEAVKAAQGANKLKQALNVFNNAMNRSYYTGARLGSLPSTGWQTALMPGDLSPEQEADRAANQMLPDAIETLRSAMGSVRWSNLDNRMAQTLKFDRSLSKQSRATMTAWTNAAADRLSEYGKFLSVMNNPNTGLTAQQSKALFEQYQENFPLINEKGDTVLRKNLNKWPLYITPKAIETFKRTGSYVPSDAEKNSFMMKLPNGQIVPIKSGKVESALKKGATLL